VEEGCVAAVEHRTLDDVRWVCCEVNVETATSIEDVANLVSSALRRALEEAGTRWVCARVIVQGVTEAHAELSRDPARIKAEIHRAANDLDRVWVEKIKLDTRAQLDLSALMDRDDPIGGLLRSLRTLRADPAALQEHAKRFDDLSAKLPHEYAQADGALELGAPETMRDRLDDVQSLLVSELLAGGRER